MSFKEILVLKIKHYYSVMIFETYPVHAQLNAGVSGGDSEMKSWIDSKRSDIELIENEVNEIDEIEILRNLPEGVSDEDLFSYVQNNFSSCDTEEKQKLVGMALQNIKSQFVMEE